jgi:hypothetical protein
MEPIRQELTILSADPGMVHLEAHRRLVITSGGKLRVKRNIGKIGFTVKETIGIAIINTSGITKVNKSVIIGALQFKNNP